MKLLEKLQSKEAREWMYSHPGPAFVISIAAILGMGAICIAWLRLLLYVPALMGTVVRALG